MRFLLVNPYYPISECPSPPLGLAFVAAALERAGVEVKVLDLVVYPYSRPQMESLLNDFQPEIVGATCVTMNFHDAVRVIEDVKSINPHIFTVLGGCHITFCARETLEQFPYLDGAVLGEGEDTVVELVRAMEQGVDLGHIKGLAYRKN
ncbi:MAG: cobalamin-dependent protein, partial [Pseudomonadota bacterium]